MADPLHQFKIEKIYTIPPIEFMGMTLDISITNSVMAMMIAASLVFVFFMLATLRTSLIPGRVQIMAEGLFGLIDDMTDGIIGHDAVRFFPFVFTLFLFILGCNMVGMFNFFTATSQLAVTFTLACVTMAIVITVGFWKNGIGFFKLFMPSGVPAPILLILVPIEIIAFFMRPVTLALRLFGNMIGGHIVMKVFAGFSASLIGAGLLTIVGISAQLVIVGLTALEFLVAYLQALVFAVLTCVYLSDVLHVGDH